jgi:hypothetical protein
MRIWRTQVLAMVAGALCAAGCAHPAYGPSGDSRLEKAVDDGRSKDSVKDVSAESLTKQKCTGYREKLLRAKSDDVPEVDRLAQFESLYKDIKAKNDYLDQALASNPDLQFAGDTQIPKIRDECVDALAEVKQSYYALVADISDLLVVKDVHGNPAPRLDFKRFREAINVLDPDDRDQLLARVDVAEHRIHARE